MKLRDLSYLIALAETEHFGKAAELTHVSQPTLSVQLKKLEDRLGIILVERNNKNVRLTPAGKIIAEKAKLVLREIDGIKTYASSQKDPFAGDIHLGIIPSVGPYLLPKIMGGIMKKFPKLSLWLTEDQTHVLLKKLEDGQLDLAILSTTFNNENLDTLYLFRESFVFSVFHKHPLAKKKKVSYEDIYAEQILLLTEGHCFSEQSMEICSRADLEPLDFRATSLETIRHMVAINMGSTLMPAMAVTANPLIKYIPFTEPRPARDVIFAFRKTHVRKALFQEMAGLIRSIVKNY